MNFLVFLLILAFLSLKIIFMKNLFIISLGALALGSCSVVKPTAVSASAKTLDVNQPGLYASPTVADLVVDTVKITGVAHGVVSLDKSNYNSVNKNLQIEAASNAISEVNADVLVEPNYRSVMDGNDLTVTASGYPGYYRNFHTYTEADSMALLMSYSNKVNSESGKTDGSITSKKKISKGVWIVAGVVILLSLLMGG